MFRTDIDPIQVGFLLALISVFTLVLVNAWRQSATRPKATDVSDLGKDIATSDDGAVPDAAIATNFQLVSIYPNVSFGIERLVAIPVFNILACLLGNWFTQRWLIPLLIAVRDYRSPHCYIASVHGVPQLKRVTAFISLFVFMSVTCYEIVYLSRISRHLFGSTDDSYFFIVGLLTICLLIISGAGQQRVTLISERWLLVIAYVGIHAALGFLVWFAKPTLDLTTLITILMLCVMLFLRLRQLVVSRSSARLRNALIAISTLVAICCLIRFAAFRVEWNWTALSHAFREFTPTGNDFSTSSYIVAAIASIAGAIFYNFVDFSFWQKYQSEIRSEESASEMAKRVRRPLWLYVWESPLSWLIPIAMGIYGISVLSVSDAENQPITALIDFMSRGKGLGGSTIGILFYAGLVAVCVSTVSSYLVSTVYLYRIDISRNKSPVISDGPPSIVIGVCLLFVLLPMDMIFRSTDQILDLMLSSFAPLCALTPFVVWPIFRRQSRLHLKPWAAKGMIASLIAACSFGFILGVIGVLKSASPSSLLFWVPMPASFVSAWFCYLTLVRYGQLPSRRIA